MYQCFLGKKGNFVPSAQHSTAQLYLMTACGAKKGCALQPRQIRCISSGLSPSLCHRSRRPSATLSRLFNGALLLQTTRPCVGLTPGGRCCRDIRLTAPTLGMHLAEHCFFVRFSELSSIQIVPDRHLWQPFPIFSHLQPFCHCKCQI